MKGGHAPVGKKKKLSLRKAFWRQRDVKLDLSLAAKSAFDWLRKNNPTYERLLQTHRSLLQTRVGQEQQRVIPTAQLLLHMPGVEVAARPWRQRPLATATSDPDCYRWGMLRPVTSQASKPASLARCRAAARATQQTSPIFPFPRHSPCPTTQDKGVGPDELASNQQIFSGCWEPGMPNLFFFFSGPLRV